MATLYYANKTLFDDIMLNDYSSVSGRFLDGTFKLLYRHKAAVYAMGTGAVIFLGEPTNVGKVVGSVLIIAGAKKAYDFESEFVTQNVNSINIEMDGTPGVNNRNALSSIQLQSDVAKTVSFNTTDRTVIASDASKTNAGPQLFFKFTAKYNGFVQQINPVLQWLNAHVPFVNIDLLNQEIAPSSSATTNNPIDATTLSHLTFSITDPNLTLVSTSLTATGQLSIKVKIVGTPATTPVESYLNYTYSDEFSTFSGKLPIEVNADFVITNVSYTSWVNVGIPCPNYYRSGEANITITFNNQSTPTSGILKLNTFWNNNDGNYAGVTGNTGVLNIDISTLEHSGNELYYRGHGFCWGVSSTVLTSTFQYESPSGSQSNVYSTIIPRP